MPVSELLELRFAGCIIEEAAGTYEKVCIQIQPADSECVTASARPW
jgi:hypothetical protein